MPDALMVNAEMSLLDLTGQGPSLHIGKAGILLARRQAAEPCKQEQHTYFCQCEASAEGDPGNSCQESIMHQAFSQNLM